MSLRLSPVIQPGTYLLRVIAVAPTGQPLGHFSDALVLVVE